MCTKGSVHSGPPSTFYLELEKALSCTKSTTGKTQLYTSTLYNPTSKITENFTIKKHYLLISVNV